MNAKFWLKLAGFLLLAVAGISFIFSRLFTSFDLKWVILFSGASYLFLLFWIYLALRPFTQAFHFLSLLLRADKTEISKGLSELTHTNNFYLKSLRKGLIPLLSLVRKQLTPAAVVPDSFFKIADLAIQRATYSYPDLQINKDLASDIELPVFSEALQQSLWELIKNAAQAQQGSEGKIFIRSYKKENRWFCFEVEDRGPGMSEASLKQASDLYFTTKANSTGLGLPFVQSTLDRVGGLMKLQSVSESEKESRGLKVSLFIPLDYISHVKNLQAKSYKEA